LVEQWIWQNHGAIVILLKVQSIVFAQIMVAHCDSDNLTANPNMHV
jgi:hypothetical protein